MIVKQVGAVRRAVSRLAGENICMRWDLSPCCDRTNYKYLACPPWQVDYKVNIRIGKWRGSDRGVWKHLRIAKLQIVRNDGGGWVIAEN